MNDKMEKLYTAIENKFDHYLKRRELFGEDHFYTTNTFHEWEGLCEAFEVVFGMRYTEYLLTRTEVIE